jgi:large subunit ribosomal protein L21
MSSYAIVEIGGLQYKLGDNEKVEVGKVQAKKDKTYKADKVLLIKDGKKVSVGAPYIKGASVTFEVLREFKGEKTVSYKYKRRKSSKHKKGHRQQMCLLKVKEIKAE